MELRTILHTANIDAYQKVLLMYLLDAQKNGKEWVWFEDIVAAMGVSGKCFREKANMLIENRWITKGRRGYYSLNKFPTLF